VGVNTIVQSRLRRIFALSVLGIAAVLAIGTVLTVALSAQGRPELVVSVGHSWAPLNAAFARGHLATAVRSTVALIDLSTGLTVARLPQDGHIVALAASPDGDIIAVGTCGRSVALWDVKSRRLLRRIEIRRECVNSASFHPDGSLLAISTVGSCGNNECCHGGCDARRVQIWDVRSGVLKQELAPDGQIGRVVFSRDGRWLATVDSAAKTTLFEWPSGRQLRTFGGLANVGAPEGAGLSSPDGKYLAWQAFNELQVWDVASGARVALPAPRSHDASEWTRQDVPGTGAEFLNDGRLAYVEENRLLIVTLPNGPVERLPLEKLKVEWTGDLGFTADVSWLRVHRDGRTIAGTYDTRTVLWDIAKGRRRDLTSSVLTTPTALQWSRAGVVAWGDLHSGVWAWSDRSGEPLNLDLDALRQRKLIEAFEDHPTGDLRVSSPDGRWIADVLNGAEPAVKVSPVTGGGDAVTLDTNHVTYGPQPPAFSGDSRRLATFVKGTTVTLWSTGSWRIERSWTLPGTGHSLMFEPRGSRLAVAGDGEAAIWDGDTGRKLMTLTSPGSARFLQIAWSPEGDRVVAAADDGVLWFWKAADGQLLASLYALGSRDWLLVTPDGRIDGNNRALATLVAWRTGDGDRVTLDKRLTNQHRVRRLWLQLLPRTAPR
jgi:WD40 repeat protein